MLKYPKRGITCCSWHGNALIDADGLAKISLLFNQCRYVEQTERGCSNCITNSGRSFFWRGKLTQLLYRKEVRKQTIMCTCFLHSLIFFPSVEIFLQWCCFSNSIFERHYLSKHFNHYSWHAANTETFIQMFPSYCMRR